MCNGIEENNGMFKHSIFIKKINGTYEAYLHADIVRFNEGCMILYPFDYILYEIWKHQYTKRRCLYKNPKINWNREANK